MLGHYRFKNILGWSDCIFRRVTSIAPTYSMVFANKSGILSKVVQEIYDFIIVCHQNGSVIIFLSQGTAIN